MKCIGCSAFVAPPNLRLLGRMDGLACKTCRQAWHGSVCMREMHCSHWKFRASFAGRMLRCNFFLSTRWEGESLAWTRQSPSVVWRPPCIFSSELDLVVPTAEPLLLSHRPHGVYQIRLLSQLIYPSLFLNFLFEVPRCSTGQCFFQRRIDLDVCAVLYAWRCFWVHGGKLYELIKPWFSSCGSGRCWIWSSTITSRLS